MNQSRLPDYLEHIQQASSDIQDFVGGQTKEAFMADRRTQRAVIMSLIIIGEAATKVMEHHPAFTGAHPEIPWRNMRGMRNRMAHGYFDVNLELIWETAQTWVPGLMAQLRDIRR